MADRYNDEIYKLQSDYICGTGNHGPVLNCYKDLLIKYKQKLEQCIIFQSADIDEVQIFEEDEENNSYKKLLKRDIITAVCIIIFGLDGSKVVWAVMGFIIAVVFFITGNLYSDDEGDGLILFCAIYPIVGAVLSLVAGLLGIGIVAWLWYFLPVAFHVAKMIVVKNSLIKIVQNAHEKNKREVIRLNKIDKEIEEIAQQLKDLLPQLRDEYKSELSKCITKYGEEEKRRLKMKFEKLPEPKHFWWEVRPRNVLERVEYEEYKRWKCYEWEKCIAGISKPKREFNAEEEYSPIVRADKNLYRENKEYTKNHGGNIIDIYVCVMEQGTESELVTEKEYVNSDWKRKRMTADWIQQGEKIQRAYQNGEISEQAYKDNMHEFYMASGWVDNVINEQADVTKTESSLTMNTYFEWIGQAMLLSTGTGYELIDLRCRRGREYDCAGTLLKYDVRKIHGNFASWDADFMAFMYRFFKIGEPQDRTVNESRKGIGTVQNKKMIKEEKMALIFGLLSIFCLPVLSIPGIIFAKSAKDNGGKNTTTAYALNIIGLVSLGMVILYAFAAILVKGMK